MPKQLIEILRLSIGGAGAGVAVAVLQLIYVLLAARLLGLSDYGILAAATSASTLMAEIGTMGLPLLANRLLARYNVRRDGQRMIQFIRHSDRIFAKVLGLAGLVLILAWIAVQGAQAGSSMATAILLTAVLLGPAIFRLTRRHQLAGLGYPALAAMVETGFASIGGIGALLLGGGVVAVTLSYAAATVAGVLLAGIVLRRSADRAGFACETAGHSAPTAPQRKAWQRAARPMWVAAGGNAIIGRLDVVLLGLLAGFDQAGLYGAAIRISYVVGLIAQIGVPVFWPRIARAREQGDGAGVTQMSRHYLGLSTGMALIAATPLFLGAGPLIALVFGPEYEAAAALLRIVLVGQVLAGLATALTGVLLMNRQGLRYMQIMTGIVALCVVISLVLIPLLGAVGAAWAMLLTNLALALTLGRATSRSHAKQGEP